MKKNKHREIIAFGEPLMELSAIAEGELDTVGHFVSGFGGDASNFAVAASRAGGNAAMLARIGNDKFGDAFMAMWEREGVDTSLVQRDAQAPTGLYIISRNQGAHDFTYYRAGSAASRMTPDLLPETEISHARLLHVTGVTQGISTASCDAALAAMEQARNAGALVSYDPNFRPSLWPLPRARAVIHESIALADIAMPNMEEARLLLGIDEPEKAAQRFLDMGAGVVALKLGDQGALLATREGMERIPSMKVRSIDCSGAGDVFCGFFVSAHLQGRSLDWCGRFAVAAAGLSTTELGCVSSIPTSEEVLRFMACARAIPAFQEE